MTTLATVVLRDLSTNLPAAGIPGRLFFATDTGQQLRDNGTTWDVVNGYPQVLDFTLTPTPRSSGFTHTAASLPIGAYRVSVYAVCTAATSSPTLNATLNYTDTYGVQANEIINQEMTVGEFVEISAVFYNAVAAASVTLVFGVIGTISYIPQLIVFERLA